jgi:hypothetical protein
MVFISTGTIRFVGMTGTCCQMDNRQASLDKGTDRNSSEIHGVNSQRGQARVFGHCSDVKKSASGEDRIGGHSLGV